MERLSPPEPLRDGLRERPDVHAPSGVAGALEHLEAVYRYAARRLPRSEDAEDVVQETYLALAQAARRDAPIEDVGAWLLTVARRRVADRLRGRAARPVPLPEGWDGYATVRLPDDVLLDRELRSLVHVALGLLPTASRTLLLQRYCEGVSVAELAHREATTPKAVEMRLRRARAAFERRFLEVGRDWSGSAVEGAP